MPWVTPEQVLDRWAGSNKPSDEDLVELWIGDAETLVRSEFPDIDDRLEADEPALADRVEWVVVRVVTRGLRNPDGVRQQAETTGPRSESLTFVAPRPGDLYLTAQERQMLSGRPGAARPRAFTVSTIAPAAMETVPVIE